MREDARQNPAIDGDGELEIYLNGESRRVASGQTVRALIESMGLGDAAVAVEVNRAVVPRRRHEATVLQPGDTVEMVTLVGGG